MSRFAPLFVSFITLFLLGSCTQKRQQRLIGKSDRLISEKKYEEALKSLSKAVALSPDSSHGVRSAYKAGFIYEVYLRDPKAALLHYEQVRGKNQDSVRAYELEKRIGNIYFEQTREMQKALDAYEGLLASHPNGLETDFFVYRKGRSQFFLNQYQQSRETLQSLLEQFPKSKYTARARFEIGNSYFMEGKYSIAIQAFKQVVRNHPQDAILPEAKFLLAQSLVQTDQLQEALGTYRSIETIYPVPELIQQKIRAVRKRMRKSRRR